MSTFKSGYVALIGRPNVGKSTLINAIVGEKLAIVTPKPQTTRHKISGIYNDPSAQIVFLDTPGFHESKKPLNQAMNEIVSFVIADADIVCLMIDARDSDADIERGLFDRVGVDRSIVVLNKCDLIGRERFDALARRFRDEWGARELAIISALKNEGVKTLVDAIKERLPEGEALFPDDIYTEHPVRFIAGEMIREQVFLQMHEEIPYSTAVQIEEFRDATEEKPITRVVASIIVEKESQKGMVIGKGGARIKAIGKNSRIEIERLIGGKVYLELNVRVEDGWTKDREKIGKFGIAS